MAQFRWWGPALLALAFTLSIVQCAFPAPPDGASKASPRHAAADGRTCVIYRLEAITTDPELGQWIAETIPCVIEPGTWNQPTASMAAGAYSSSTGAASGPQPALRYYAPKKLLVVYHVAAVHAKVSAFLKDVKHSLPEASARKATTASHAVRDSGVVRATYVQPAAIQATYQAAESSAAYPVPAAPRPPKHLFHFIIRYEGEGIVDDNVAKLVRGQLKKDTASEKSAPAENKKDEKTEKPSGTSNPFSADGASPSTAASAYGSPSPTVPATAPPSLGTAPTIIAPAVTITPTAPVAAEESEATDATEGKEAGGNSSKAPRRGAKKMKKTINPDRTP